MLKELFKVGLHMLFCTKYIGMIGWVALELYTWAKIARKKSFSLKKREIYINAVTPR